MEGLVKSIYKPFHHIFLLDHDGLNNRKLFYQQDFPLKMDFIIFDYNFDPLLGFYSTFKTGWRSLWSCWEELFSKKKILNWIRAIGLMDQLAIFKVDQYCFFKVKIRAVDLTNTYIPYHTWHRMSSYPATFDNSIFRIVHFRRI